MACEGSAVAEADAEAAGGAHQRAVGVDLLRRGDRLGERHVDDAAVLPRDHAVDLAGGDEGDRGPAESRAEQPLAPAPPPPPPHLSQAPPPPPAPPAPRPPR